MPDQDNRCGDGKLRIMLVDSYPAWNALERYTCRIATGMKERGHHVAFACRRGSQVEARMQARGMPCYRAAPRNAVDFWAALRLAWTLRRGNYDLVHSHYTRDIGPVVLAAGLARKPAILHRHTFSLTTRRRIRSMRGAARIIAVSEAVHGVLTQRLGLPGEKVTTVFAGIDLRQIKPRGGDRVVLAARGIAPGAPVFGMVNRLDGTKRCDTFLRAAAMIKQTHPEAHYIIVGEGPQRQPLIELTRDLGLEKEVLFTGFVEDAIAWMREFDAFVAAGDGEAFSAAILEAMACGLPVIATRWGGNIEEVVEGETGLLFPVGDEQALSSAMLQVLENPEQARQWGAAGQERVHRYFNLERELDQIEAIYHKCANGS